MHGASNKCCDKWRGPPRTGLTTFKLDHAQSNIPNLPEAQTDLYAGSCFFF